MDCPLCNSQQQTQPPLALAVPLSRFTSRVGGGSAFFVRHRMTRLISIEGDDGIWAARAYHRNRPDRFPTLTSGSNGWTEREPYRWFDSRKEAKAWADAHKPLLPRDE